MEVSARREAVVTANPAGVEAGLAVLRDGGNAVDAAAAAIMALCVAAPASVGFGGYGGTMLVYLAKTGRVEAIDSDSRAPLGYRPEIFAGKPELAQHGYLSVGVPGVTAGIDLAIRRYGTRKWPELAKAAIRLAEDGIPADALIAGSLKRWARSADPTSLRAVLPDGRMPRLGERWRQPLLARFIRQIAEDPSQFYRGQIARKIIAQVRANGGILTEQDFSRFEAQVVEPIRISYRGHEVFTPPLPAGGISSLAILKTLEQFDLTQMEPWSAGYFHIVLEACKLCWRDRLRLMGDPEFVNVPVDEILSPATAAARAGRIKPGQILSPSTQPVPPAGNHTVNVVAVDREGNAVSWTATHGGGFGSHVAIDGMGLFLGHGMSRFTLDPASPNAPQPGKRVGHNMAPLFALQAGRPKLIVGMPGGTRIPTVTAQLAINALEFRADVVKTLSAPRVHVEADEPTSPSPRFPAEVARELKRMGHRFASDHNTGGVMNAALIQNGQVFAASSRGAHTEPEV